MARPPLPVPDPPPGSKLGDMMLRRAGPEPATTDRPPGVRFGGVYLSGARTPPRRTAVPGPGATARPTSWRWTDWQSPARKSSASARHTRGP